MAYVQTVSGRAVCLVSPQASSIALSDIAHHLSVLPRFNGAAIHERQPVSVAVHSLLVHQIVRHHAKENVVACLWALLHDAHEAYTGDLTTPVKQALRWHGAHDAVERMQRGLDRAILEAFGLGERTLFVNDAYRIVEHADRVALRIEKEAALAPCQKPWGLELPENSTGAALPSFTSPATVAAAYTRAALAEAAKV